MPTCLLLKPPVPDDPASRLEQIEHIENLLRAFDMLSLTLLDRDRKGTTVADITDALIEQVYQANIVVIDANRYGSDSLPPSPSLYYLMALSHAWGNKTILVARALEYIPFVALRRHHTLILGNDSWRFLDDFKRAVQEIQDGAGKPDNPVQQYLQQRRSEEKLAQTQAELAAQQAQLRKLQAEEGEGRIVFRRVPSPLQED